MFIIGDFNVDIYSAIIKLSIAVKNNPKYVLIIFLYSDKIYIYIDKYTRENKKRGTSTLLDNIYTNVTQTPNSIQSSIFKTNISDHY